LKPAASANLLLIGLRGSGKSTVGRLAAARLDRPLIDLDRETLNVLGLPTASEAFRRVGEPSFRAAEMMALEQVLDTTGQVIALGGGTPTALGAADRLQAERDAGRAWIAYLHAPPATLRSRLAGDDLANRPGLLGPDPVGEVDRVYALRDPIYRPLADVIIEVGESTPQEAADRVVRAFQALA
jgi:shikimate kinase